MADRRTLLIINPKSQNGSLGKRWPQLSQRVRRKLGSFEEAFTTGPNEATRLCREALQDGVDTVVAIGGDGTINEVVNGFFDKGKAIRPSAQLGILPYGTGGDFRKSVKIPNDIDKAAEILAAGRSKTIDVGLLRYTTREGAQAERIFINIASFGISGEIDEAVNKSSKRLGGKLTFTLATAKVSLRYRDKRTRIVFDDNPATTIENDYSTVAVANGCYFGGGMFVAPHALLDDGQFDVVAAEAMGAFESLRNVPRLFKGTHLDHPKVSARRARKVYAEPVDPSDKVLLDVDGEDPGMLPASFEIVPSALSLIVPGDG